MKKLSSPNLEEPASRKLVLKSCVFALLVLSIVVFLVVFQIFGTDTSHANRTSIWWSERARNLIPPDATGITFRQHFLDHYATYKISEPDLNHFLNKRFAINGKMIDSFNERTPAGVSDIGQEVGPLGWVISKNTVRYSYAASNGGMHNFYHDTKTGMTFQESAYW